MNINVSTEVILLSKKKDNKIDERVIGYINELPMVVASHLCIGYFVTCVDDVELFSIINTNINYSLKLNAYPFQVTETIDIGSLNMYQEDPNHPLFKASILNKYHSPNEVITDYNSRLALIDSGKDYWVNSEQESIVHAILQASKVGYICLWYIYYDLCIKNSDLTLEDFIQYPLTIIKMEKIDVTDLVKDTLFSSLKYLNKNFNHKGA